jgi:hypothetical protein
MLMRNLGLKNLFLSVFMLLSSLIIGNPWAAAEHALFEVYPEAAPSHTVTDQPDSVPDALLPFLGGAKQYQGPAGVIIEVEPARWAALDDAGCETCDGGAQQLQIGVHEGVDFLATLQSAKGFLPLTIPRETSGGLLERGADGALLWWMRIMAPGAGGMRLALDDFQLPAGISAYWVSEGGEVFGPYTGKGPLGTGTFWTNTLSGGQGYFLLLAGDEAAEAHLFDSRFRITKAAAMRPDFGVVARERAGGYQKQLESCMADASCFGTGDFPLIDILRRAVAYLVYERDDGSFICTGGLINDTDPRSAIPYLLTANHCFATQQSADSLECFWDFQTSRCNVGFIEAAPVGGVARSLGAQLLATGTVTDFTLVRLNGTLPAGRWFLGWTALPPAAGETVYRIAHPRGTPQAFSRHDVIGTPELLCDGRRNINYLHTVRTLGATAPGSSGSPAVNQFGQVTGQLYGNCAEDGCGPCDTRCVYYELDGRFAVTFPAIAPWIANTSGTPVNDAFANAITLTGAEGVSTATNRGGSRESGEPNHGGFSTGASVWWRWTAPRGGPVTFSTCGSDFDTVLAVYRGTERGALTPVATGRDECGQQSQATFTAAPGTVYHVAVQGYAAENGTIALAWQTGAALPQAPNLSAIAPGQGTPAGGVAVTLTGTNLNGVSQVQFGGMAASNFNVVNATTVTCTSPPGSGLTDVTVTTARGTSNGVTFLYTNAPPPPTSVPISRTVAYGNCWARQGVIEVPGATRVRLVLDAVQMEFCCDELRVAGVLITGADSAITTGFVVGNRIDLSLTSDSNNSGSFRIAAVEFEGTASADPILSGPLFEGPAGDDCVVSTGPCGTSKTVVNLHGAVKMSFAQAPFEPVTLTPEREIAGVLPLPGATVGKVWRIGPRASFDAPTVVHVPLPDGLTAGNARVLYFVDDPAIWTWHCASNVLGWLAAPPQEAVSEDGTRCLALEITHGGRVQVVEDTYSAFARAAGVAPAPSLARGASFAPALVLTVGILLLMHAVKRRRRKRIAC